MSRLLLRTLVCLLVAGLAAGVLATPAAADSFQAGNLYGVYAEGGSFANATTYTVFHHITYGPSVFPDGLRPAAFPSEGQPIPGGVIPGGEFFLIGELRYANGIPAHFLVSASGEGGYSSLSTAFDRKQDLLAGVLRLDDSLGGAGVVEGMSADDFWNLMSNGVDATGFKNYFFSLGADLGPDRSPVGLLDDYSLSSSSGSEDLFGYSPGTAGTPTGSLSGLINSVTYTDGDQNSFSAVPEPGTFALLFGAFAVGGAVRRRRRRAA